MQWPAEFQLRELSTPRYWLRRKHGAKRAQTVARWGALLRHQAGSARERVGAGWRVMLGSARVIFLAVACVALLELMAWALRSALTGIDLPLIAAPQMIPREGVLSLVESTVTVGATLLGLYYATVGVIASTIYKSVPGDVRELFITERNSETYLGIVLLTVAGGITVLTSAALGHDVTALTLLALGIFAALTCVGLVGVTKRLLAYFDPSQLALPLMRALGRAVHDAASAKTRALPHRQDEAQAAAYRALISYRHLVELIEGTDLRNATGPVTLTRQMLHLLELYSSRKHAVPTDSRWWRRVPQHVNWLTADHARLQLALNTSSGFPPDLQPDYLWFERALARLLERSLSVAFRSQGGADALAVSENVADLVFRLTARFQIEEALVIEAMWGRVVTDVTDSPHVAASDADDSEVRLNQMAAAESLVRPYTSMVLGLSHAATSLTNRDLPAEFEDAIQSPNGLYRGTLPTDTRRMLERFATAIKREVASERHRITPPWWINHLAARSMTEALVATEKGILKDLRENTIDRVSMFQENERPDLAAVAGMASLELLHKLEFHQSTVVVALEKLEQHRNENTSFPDWPTRSPVDFKAGDEHQTLVRKLSELLPALRRIKFDPREPDLYGQLYQFVVEGAFTAILMGDHDRGLRMYEAALEEVDAARNRISTDLAYQPDRTRILYTLEPVITAMDLAGYALLMQELDGSGIWNEIKTSWEVRLAGNADLSRFLLTTAEFIDDTLSMTTGGLERSRRSIQLRDVLEERNIHESETHFWRANATRSRPHPSPIVSAYAPRRMGNDDDLYALFVAEFLVHHLPEGAELPRKAQRLAESIQRYREFAESVHEDGDANV